MTFVSDGPAATVTVAVSRSPRGVHAPVTAVTAWMSPWAAVHRRASHKSARAGSVARMAVSAASSVSSFNMSSSRGRRSASSDWAISIRNMGNGPRRIAPPRLVSGVGEGDSWDGVERSDMVGCGAPGPHQQGHVDPRAAGAAARMLDPADPQRGGFASDPAGWRAFLGHSPHLRPAAGRHRRHRQPPPRATHLTSPKARQHPAPPTLCLPRRRSPRRQPYTGPRTSPPLQGPNNRLRRCCPSRPGFLPTSQSTPPKSNWLPRTPRLRGRQPRPSGQLPPAPPSWGSPSSRTWT